MSVRATMTRGKRLGRVGTLAASSRKAAADTLKDEAPVKSRMRALAGKVGMISALSRTYSANISSVTSTSSLQRMTEWRWSNSARVKGTPERWWQRDRGNVDFKSVLVASEGQQGGNKPENQGKWSGLSESNRHLNLGKLP